VFIRCASRSLLSAALLFAWAQTRAATITVTSTSGATGVQNECVLRDAITAASFHAAQGGCPAGDGADTIVLPAASTITLTDTDNQNNGRNGLPVVYDTLTIEGNGATIQRSAGCGVYDAPGASKFRFFLVAQYNNSILELDNLTLRNGCALDDSTVNSGNGGAVLAIGIGRLRTDHVVFAGNAATNTGGAVHLAAANAYNYILNTSMQGNTAGSDGGALATDISTTPFAVEIQNSTFRNNTAAGLNASSGNVESSGGALRLDAIDVTIGNSTFYANYADDGGAIAVGSTGSMIMDFSTIAGNTLSFAIADLVGGGLWVQGTAHASDSIIAGNSGGDCYTTGATLTVGDADLASDGSCAGFSIPASDPKFAALVPAGNGLPMDVLPLQSGSPAIDVSTTCDTSGFAYSEVYDERGQRRPFGGGCDLGAYEVGDTIFRSGLGYYEEY